MLLIAQPKSASTSLANTLGKILNMEVRLGIPKNKIDIKCEGFPEIQKYHDNMIERSPLFLQQVLSGKKILFKEHLMPTKRHLAILHKIKYPVCVLLRTPQDSLDSYMRLKNNKIDFEQLGIDLENFHNTYLWWASNKPYAHVIFYRDLVLNWNISIKKILKIYKRQIPKNIDKFKLQKRKYSGVGVKRIMENKECYL
jgi:hypothetical protein